MDDPSTPSTSCCRTTCSVFWTTRIFAGSCGSANSYGAVVITSVADRPPGRVAHLVFLDGAMAADGQAVLDFFPPDRRAARQARVETEEGAGGCRRRPDLAPGASPPRTTQPGSARGWRRSPSRRSPSRSG